MYTDKFVEWKFWASLTWFYLKKNESRNISEEFKLRNLGICAYCNLNDRRKVHSAGFDRSKDKHQVNSIEQQLQVT